MAKYTNTLSSHYGESNSSRADKMSGWISERKRKTGTKGGYSISKKISNRKRRMFLKNSLNFDKI